MFFFLFVSGFISMFFKCSRLLVTSFISLSILFSVVSSAFAGKDALKGAETEASRTTRVLRSARKALAPVKPANAVIHKAPIAAPHTGTEVDGTDPDLDSAPKAAAAAPNPAATTVESRKRPLDNIMAAPVSSVTPNQLVSIIRTTDLVTGRLWDFSPALTVRFDDEKSKAAHQAQIDEARKTLIACLLGYHKDQQPLLLDRFIRFTNGFDFLALDDPNAFIQAGIQALNIEQEDPESIVRHANQLLLTGIYDHTNVADPLWTFVSKRKENRWLIASDIWPLLNVSTEVPAKNYEARLVVRMLRVTSTPEIQKIVQKLKDQDLFVRPEAPCFDLKFINKDPTDNEAIFQIIFAHVKGYMASYSGANASVLKSRFDEIARDERARPRVADQSEHSSQQI